MTWKPILFTGQMVRRLLTCADCGRISAPFPCEHCGGERFAKTQTRRVVGTPQRYVDFYTKGNGRWKNAKTGMWEEIAYEAECEDGKVWFLVAGDQGYEGPILARYQPGDKLWVRETFAVIVPPPIEDWPVKTRRECTIYRATHERPDSLRWRASIHMPRWASRIALEVQSVRVERVQEISEEDAKAEGVEPYCEDGCWVYRDYCLGDGAWCFSARGSFFTLWDSINGKRHPWASNPWVWVYGIRRTGIQTGEQVWVCMH